MALTDPSTANILSGGTNAHARTLGDQFIPEVWGQAILSVFQQKIMMKNVATNISSDVSSAGDVIHLPNIGVPELDDFTQGSEVAVTTAGSETVGVCCC